MTSRTKTLWSIQYLRAIAAFGVIVFHSLGGTGHDFTFGAIGIHLFFVISGFLMWTITAHQEPDILKFLVSRIRRIVPLYWLAIFLTLALASYNSVPFYQVSWHPAHVLKSLLFIPQVGVAGGIYPVLYQGWTLQYEMFFYAVFALCLNASVNRRLWLLTAIIGTLSALGMAFPDSANPLVATYTDPICLEFLAGAWTARLCASRNLPPLAALALLIFGSAGLWLSFRYEQSLDLFSWLATALAASAIIAGAVWLEREGRLPRLGWLKYAGEASYALYLFQDIGFFVAMPIGHGWPVLARAGLFCICAVITGLLFYTFAERPFQNLLARKSFRTVVPLAG